MENENTGTELEALTLAKAFAASITTPGTSIRVSQENGYLGSPVSIWNVNVSVDGDTAEAWRAALGLALSCRKAMSQAKQPYRVTRKVRQAWRYSPTGSRTLSAICSFSIHP